LKSGRCGGPLPAAVPLEGCDEDYGRDVD